MSKVRGLYQSYIKEREAEFKDYITGGSKMEELQKFLKQKLKSLFLIQAKKKLVLLHMLVTALQQFRVLNMQCTAKSLFLIPA
jgi:hypothetical protein